MVLVTGDQFANGLGMHLAGGVVDGIGREGRVALGSEDAAPEAHVEPHRSGLVDHDDASPVGVVDHVFGVGVVGGAKRVGTYPGEEFEIVQQVRVVVALTDHWYVLVLAEAGKVERFVVDQETDAIDLDGAYPDTLVVTVHDGLTIQQLQLKIIKVAVARSPLMDIGHVERSTASGASRYLVPIDITQDQLRLKRISVLGLGSIRDHTVAGIKIGSNRDVGEVGGVSGVKPDIAVNARVVQEAVPVTLTLSCGSVLDNTRRDRLPMQDVVDQGGDSDLLTRPHMISDVRFERRVAALVGNNLGLVNPDRRTVCCGFEVQHDPLSLPAPRHPQHPLVPDIAEIVPHGCVSSDVVKARRHSHLSGIGQWTGEPAIVSTVAARVKGELPQTVEAFAFPGT